MSDPIINAIKEMKERLSRIVAAREGEPPMPIQRDSEDESDCDYLDRVKAHDRQGWDACAALRVELAAARNRGADLEGQAERLADRLSRYEALKGEVEEVPGSPYTMTWAEFSDYATRLRARLIGTMAVLAHAESGWEKASELLKKAEAVNSDAVRVIRMLAEALARSQKLNIGHVASHVMTQIDKALAAAAPFLTKEEPHA